MKQSTKNIRILFLSAWYPSKEDSMLGLFVERHARAVSKKCDVAVLYIQQCITHSNEKYKTDILKDNNFTQVIVYYNDFLYNIPIFSGFIKLFRFCKAYIIGFSAIKKHFGNYDLIHVNILTRTAVVAYLNKIFSGKPYIITEHWSRYMPVVNTYSGVLRKWITKLVVKKASAITTVTNNLKNAMIGHKLNNKNFQVVPNVVDTNFFIYSKKSKKSKIEILHVSCFEDKSKNISGILRVLKRLSEKRNDFICRMVGDGVDKKTLEKYAEELGILNKCVFFEGLKTGKELVEIYTDADFMLMFSNYETMSVVIAEAFSAGLPVVSTNVGGITEIVSEDKGILVDSKDELALENAINLMLSNYMLYDRCSIRQYAIGRFSIEVVSEAFYKIYSDILKK